MAAVITVALGMMTVRRSVRVTIILDALPGLALLVHRHRPVRYPRKIGQ